MDDIFAMITAECRHSTPTSTMVHYSIMYTTGIVYLRVTVKTIIN